MAHLDRMLIVGGGIGGLTLATALRRQGSFAELIERSPSWRPVGAGIAVQPNGIRVLRSLGINAAIERAGTEIRYWDFCDQGGELLSETDLVSLWAEAGPFIGIERARLHRALLDGAEVPCRLATSINSLIQNARGVSVEFTDGTTGEYDLVVGADGIHSAVRKLALNVTPPVYGGQMVWRSIAPVRPQGLTRLRFLLGTGGFFGLCPLDDGNTYGFGNLVGPKIEEPVAGRLKRLRGRFAEFGSMVQEYMLALRSDEQILCSAIEWVQEEVWYAGRVVLIGDAAHASSPMMGQGDAWQWRMRTYWPSRCARPTRSRAPSPLTCADVRNGLAGYETRAGWRGKCSACQLPFAMRR